MSIEILSDIIITKVHSASTFYTPKNKRASRKDRHRWAIIIKYEGETVYTSGGREILSDIHHIVILPKGCTYEWKCTAAGHYSTVEFECALTHPEPLSFLVKNGEKILKMQRELEHKRNLRSPITEMESIRDAYAMILALVQNDPEKYLPTDKQHKIAPAIDYIFQNYNKKITNDELAALTGLSTVYFRKLFTGLMGTSPVAYAHEIRIQKAKEMLGSDYGTLTDLAHTLGYANLYDFSRDFKKHTGVAPSKY